jgi:putative ABC transport system permease protein
VSILRHLTRGLRVLTRGSASDRDLDEEVRHFYDEARADEIARGVSADEARRAARLAFGDQAAVREEVRAHGWEHVIETAIADARYAGRGLRRQPGFAVVAILTLALGIGASTAIFSAVDPILIEPLPYPHADRIVSVVDRTQSGRTINVTYGTYMEVVSRGRAFSALAVADRWQPALMGLAEPERLVGDRVTPDYFRVLGVGPSVGRDFDDADDRTGGPRVAIVSDGFARRHFGGAPAVLGQPITLDGDDYTVVGVMPRTFDNVLSPDAEVWAPRRYRARAAFQSAEWGHHLRMIGRLANGVSIEQARGELDAIGAAPSAAFPRPPWAAMQPGLTIAPLQAMVTGDVRPALLAILAGVALVLIVASVNVTNLLLARGAQRRGELALRAALGADRHRIVRQLLTETLLLTGCGGALGLLVAASGVRALVALAPEGMPRAGAIALNAPAFAFAAVLTAMVGFAVGVYPALIGARRDRGSALQPGVRLAGAASHAMRRALVVAEVALALALLVGAGLMLRSLAHLMSTKPGFDASHVLTMQIQAAGRAYAPDRARYQFFEQALDAVRRLPGVTSAAFTSQLPLSGDRPDTYGVHFGAKPADDPNGDPAALRYAVTPDWFKTMHIPLRRGRLIDDRDRPGTQESIVISESLAEQMFPGEDPVGQRLRAGPEVGTDRPWDVVVGVVGDVKQTSLALDDAGAFYVPMGQWPWVDNVQSIVVRTSGDAAALAPAVKRAIWSVDRNQPIVRVATMDALVARSEAERRFVLTVFAAFGLAALALAGIGVYGMVSGGVTERLTEIGVRAALGATRVQILTMILRQGVLLAASGVALGIVGAALLSGALRTLMFGISRADGTTYGAAGALVLAIAVVASVVPAVRASRVDPAAALRV